VTATRKRSLGPLRGPSSADKGSITTHMHCGARSVTTNASASLGARSPATIRRPTRAVGAKAELWRPRRAGDPKEIAERQARYEKPDSKQFKIVDEATGEGSAGSANGSASGRATTSMRSAGRCYRPFRDGGSRAPRRLRRSRSRGRRGSAGSCMPTRRSTMRRRMPSAGSSGSRSSGRVNSSTQGAA
jgi:hypothetical protein